MLEIATSKPRLNSLAVGTSTVWRDWLGIVASIGCAIHCAAMPFVIAYLPALGLNFLADEAFHKWMALICFLIAIAAFLPGLKTHRNWAPIGIGATGIVLITFAAFGLAGKCCPTCEESKQVTHSESTCSDSECEHCAESRSKETSTTLKSSTQLSTTNEKGALSAIAPWITPLGGIFLVFAHLLNRRFGATCNCCQQNTKLSEF